MPPLNLELLFSFAVTALLIELTPGPNITYLAILSVSEGRRAAFLAVLGVGLGLALMGAAAALGVAELILASSFLYEALRWAGVLFLFYLAADGWFASGALSAVKPASNFRHFRRGLITNLLNPKAALFYLTVLPTFIGGAADVRKQSIALTSIYVAVATLVHVLVVALADLLRPVLLNSGREKLVRRFLSLLLLFVAVWVLVSSRR